MESLQCLMSTHFIDSLAITAVGVAGGATSGTSEGNANRATGGVDEGDGEGLADLIANYIDVFKVARAVNSFGPLKMGGPDGIKPIMLQMLNLNYINKLTAIYKGSIIAPIIA